MRLHIPYVIKVAFFKDVDNKTNFYELQIEKNTIRATVMINFKT